MAYGMMIEALAPPTRRAIFERLAKGPASVGEIAGGLPVSRPAVSQHLKILKNAKLVSEKREGVKRIYSLDRHGLGELRAYFDSFWDEALAAFRTSAEGDDDG